jgi:hypothetical protein
MNFKNCLYREFLWWVRSPSLWWSLPPLIVIITLSPFISFFSAGLDLVDLEEIWDGISRDYQYYFKPKADESEVVKYIVEYTFAKIDTYLMMPLEDIWASFILPPIQIWAVLPLAMIVPPLAVALFNRDRLSGHYKEWVLNGGTLFSVLLAKLMVSSAFLCFMLIVSNYIYVLILSNSSERPEFFQLFDSMWLIGVIGGGLTTGMITIVLSWYTCMFSRNGSTEVYVAMLASVLVVSLVFGLVKLFGWNEVMVYAYNVLALIICIFALIPLTWLMKKEYFLTN